MEFQKIGTEKLFRDFLIEGLNININQEIKIVDVHRLPQYPIFSKNKIKINRPIIVKLNGAFSKQRFCSSLRNLKVQYNIEKKENLHFYRMFTNNERLPKELQQQKKNLLPEYKQAKAQRKRCQWKIVSCKYCLFVEGQKYEP